MVKGHVKVKTDKLLGLIERHGLEAAMEFRDLVIDQIYALKEAVESEDLDCEFELRRSYDVFIDEHEAKEIQRKYTTCVKAGHRWTKDVGFVEKCAEQVRVKTKGPYLL